MGDGLTKKEVTAEVYIYYICWDVVLSVSFSSSLKSPAVIAEHEKGRG